MPQPLISVLMPVYNAQETLEEAIHSVLEQDLEDFELVAVDDGSTDGTAEILETLAARDNRLRSIHRPHTDLLQTLNAGIEACRGRYLARMDADDLSAPSRLSKQVELLETTPDVGVVGCLVRCIPPEAILEGYRRYEEWVNRLRSPEDISREIYIECPIVHPTAMMRTEQLRALGGYQDLGWAEDYDLFLRCHLGGMALSKVPEVLYYWRDSPNRLTRTDRRYSITNFMRCKAHYLAQGPLRDVKRVMIWGTGTLGKILGRALRREGRPPWRYVDINPRKIGKEKQGVPVIGPDDLPPAGETFLLACVRTLGARDEIRSAARAAGYTEGKDFLCVA